MALKNTGATLPGAGANVDIGNPDWISPGNITTDSDVTYAYCTLPADPYSGYTDILRGYTYGFDIPSDAVISGVEVTVRAKVVATPASIYQLSLRNGSTLVGTAKTVEQALTASFANYTFGSNSDLWGSSSAALAAIINTSDFGIYLSGVKASSAAKTIYIQYIKVTVYYYVPPDATIQSTSSITSAGATGNGTISDDGGALCQARFRHSKVLQRDDFEWGNDGDDITDSGGGITWSKIVAGTSTAKISIDFAHGGTRSLKLHKDATNVPIAYFTQTAGTGYIIRARCRNAAVSYAGLRHGNGTKLIRVKYIDANLKYVDNTTTWVDTGVDIGADEFALLEIRNINWTAGTYDIYHNGVIAKPGATMQVTGSAANQVHFIETKANSDCWWDDVEVLEDWTLTDFEPETPSLSTTDTYYKDITGLSSATDYVAETQAKNAAGEGGWSSSDYFKTLLEIYAQAPEIVFDALSPELTTDLAIGTLSSATVWELLSPALSFDVSVQATSLVWITKTLSPEVTFETGIPSEAAEVVFELGSPIVEVDLPIGVEILTQSAEIVLELGSPTIILEPVIHADSIQIVFDIQLLQALPELIIDPNAVEMVLDLGHPTIEVESHRFVRVRGRSPVSPRSNLQSDDLRRPMQSAGRSNTQSRDLI